MKWKTYSAAVGASTISDGGGCAEHGWDWGNRDRKRKNKIELSRTNERTEEAGGLQWFLKMDERKFDMGKE